VTELCTVNLMLIRVSKIQFYDQHKAFCDNSYVCFGVQDIALSFALSGEVSKCVLTELGAWIDLLTRILQSFDIW
jgi:hypothetical protein